MDKDKKMRIIWVSLAILVIAVCLAFINRGKSNSGDDENRMALFYSLACPHCQNVEAFIKENKIEEKYDFDSLEISESKYNTQLLINKAERCGLDTKTLGVPFLWTGDTCIVGDTDIIEFFKK